MDLSIILTHRPDGAIRDKHLSWSVDRYKFMFPSADIVISQDRSAKGWVTFNKAKYINRGVRKAKFDNLLIVDIDCILQYEAIIGGVSLINKYGFLIPYNKLHRLSEEKTYTVLATNPTKSLPDVGDVKWNEYSINKPIGGCHIITKNNFYEVGGYDERFVGWGGEDGAFNAAASILLGSFKRLEYKSLHLWHPVAPNVAKGKPGIGNGEGKGKYTPANRAMLEQYRKSDKEKIRGLRNR